jgi:hypothetical protein
MTIAALSTAPVLASSNELLSDVFPAGIPAHPVITATTNTAIAERI